MVPSWLRESKRATDHNTQRPHTSLGGLTPVAFANRSSLDYNPIGLCL